MNLGEHRCTSIQGEERGEQVGGESEQQEGVRMVRKWEAVAPRASHGQQQNRRKILCSWLFATALLAAVLLVVRTDNSGLLSPAALDWSDHWEKSNPAASDPDCSAVDPSDLKAVMACWKAKGDHDMQLAKNRAFDAAVAGNYDDYDVKKGRAMNKFFHGAMGAGEGYNVAGEGGHPSFPKPGEKDRQGLEAAIAENWEEYDAAIGRAIPKDPMPGSPYPEAEGRKSPWSDYWARR